MDFENEGTELHPKCRACKNGSDSLQNDPPSLNGGTTDHPQRTPATGKCSGRPQNECTNELCLDALKCTSGLSLTTPAESSFLHPPTTIITTFLSTLKRTLSRHAKIVPCTPYRKHPHPNIPTT